MAARAYWKGYLRLSLVTIGIELYAAVARAQKLNFHQIHKPSRQRIRYQKVVPGIGPVDAADIVNGFEIEKNEYVLIEPDELDEIKLESKRTIDLVQFVDLCEIDPRFFDRPYYVTPQRDDVAEEGFSVVREALRKSKKTGLGQLAMRGRDYIVALRPCGSGLLLETLRFADEIRDSDTIFDSIPDVDIDGEMLTLAGELIARKSGAFDSSDFRSHYADALRELVAEKRKSGRITSASEAQEHAGATVIDLMEALKKSVAGGRTQKQRRPAKTSRGAKRNSSRRRSRASGG
jgi:DNA end-binding protein Ku